MSLTELQKRKLIHMFELLDADQNGVLEYADFKAVVETLADERGWPPGSRQRMKLTAVNRRIWNTLFSSCDLNQDDQISLAEWLAYHIQALTGDGGEAQGFSMAVAAISRYFYELIDVDGDGTATKEDFKIFCTAHGIPEEDSQFAFEELDRDGNGVLSRDEILTLVREFYLSDDPSAPGNWFFGDF